MSFVDQAISELSAAVRPSSFSSRMLIALGRRARQLRVRFGDPLVKFTWCGETILLPMSHDLPQFANAFPEYNFNLGHLAAVMARCLGRPLVAIDIGANVGDTAVLLLKNGAERVVCVEGSPRYAELLKRNTCHLPGIVISQGLAAFANAPDRICISESMGTGHVVPSSDGAGVPVLTLEEVLAAHDLNPRAVDLVKIDTDGYDGAIIRHHAAFFAHVKPIVHFEYMFSSADRISNAPHLPDEEVWETLAEAGYDRIVIYRNTGEAVAYRGFEQAGRILRDMYSSRSLGAYADIAAFPNTAHSLADEAARTFGLNPMNS